MKLSVVIASRATETSLSNLQRIFTCLNRQTFKDFEIILVCDRFFEKEEFWIFQEELLETIDGIPLTFVTNLNSTFIPQTKGGASAWRNAWIQKATGEFIQLFDDDNAFDETYFETEFQQYGKLKKQTKSECILCPTLKYRETWTIQNQGFSHFCYRQARPKIHFLHDTPYGEIQMFSGNGIFGKREVLQSVSYDETIARIAEDIDFTLSLHEQGNKLFCIKDLEVQHYERDKTLLEQARIWSYNQAKQKSKNRFLFVHKHGNGWQKIQFYTIGLPWCLLWLSIKALRFWGKGKWKIIKGLRRGVFEGIKHIFIKK